VKILKLEAKNFKSFHLQVDYVIQPGLNIIVGENNVGKSNIFAILQKLIELLEKPNNFEITDAYYGDIDNDVELKLFAKLDDDDIKFLIRRFDVSGNYKEDFLKIFGDDLKINFEFSKFRGSKLFITFGKMKILERQGSFKYYSPSSGYNPKRWRNIVNGVSEKHGNLFEAIEKELQPTGSTESFLEFDFEPRKSFADLFKEKIIIFPEFRERPSSEAQVDIFLSPKGVQVSSVLFNLKNGDLMARSRFKKIQDYFSQIFPNLKLDVKQGHQIVVVKSDKHEMPQESIGAGIVEIIIFLTHLIGTENHVFAIDEPELHLHPHAKRSVSDLINLAAMKNQIICITHSTNFIHIDSVNNIVCVKDMKGHSELILLPDSYFNQEEINKLHRITESRQKEFFFARSVLLVEGDTEAGAIPIFAKKIDQDLNMNNVSVISVDSHYFALFIKLLRGFKIPNMVMLDFDTLANIEASIEIQSKKVNTSSLIKQLDELGELTEEDKKIVELCQKGIVTESKDQSKYDENSIKKLKPIIQRHEFVYLLPSYFEGLFTEPHYQKIIRTAKKNFKGNKVLQGKYIAENISDVPPNLVEVIDKILMLIKN